MLHKTYVKLTRRNKVLKVVKEVYLRKDIYCGSELCQECYSHKNIKASISEGHFAPQRLTTPKSSMESHVNYLVIDTNIVLHQMDLLQRPQFQNVIVLQTVLEEVKNQSPQLYNELRELCADEAKHFYVFSNEFREETHIERLPGESPNDLNDRAIRVATQWYQNHLSSLPCRVLMISNDIKNVQEANKHGVNAKTVFNYVQEIGDSDLLDTLSHGSEFLSPSDPSKNSKLKPIYKDHWTEDQVLESLKKGSRKTVFQGIMRQNPDNWLEAVVPLNSPIILEDLYRENPELNSNKMSITSPSTHNRHDEILIRGRINMNRAIDGDIVLVELFPRDKWQAPSRIFVDVDAPVDEILAYETNDERDGINNNNSNSFRLDSSQDTPGLMPSGHVISIIKRNWRPYVGSIELPSVHSNNVSCNQKDDQPQSLTFVPLNRHIPKIKILSHQFSKLKDQRIVVCIDGWESHSLLPYGHYVKSLGTIGDKSVEAEALLQQHDLHLRPFSALVMGELPPKDEVIEVTQANGRLDLRSELICSIDPPGCTDIDDALHCKVLQNGNLQLGVHIADVSHYVKEGSHMDKEARKRGNTIYLVDRRIDMLPRELGEDLCSINSNVDRYAFSVLWEITPPTEMDANQDVNSATHRISNQERDDGLGVKVVDVSFHKTVIRSRANLSYGEAQLRLDDETDQTPLTKNLRILNKVAKVLKKRRMENGALILASPQVKFIKDESNQDPIDVEMYETKETNSLVEEFMLLANVAVAEQITKFFPAFALLRRHPPPNQSKFDALAVSMKRYGVKLDTSSSKRLSESLEENVERICGKRKSGENGNNNDNSDKMDIDTIDSNIVQHRDSNGEEDTDKGDEDDSNSFFNKLLRIMVTRCMNTARYFSSGTLPPSQFHHYGLACPIYTHFTSPIRRYADVVVHRLLAASINYAGISGSLGARDVQRTSDVINRRHRMAEYAGRDSVRFHTLQFFKGKTMPTQPAYVMALAANGFDVLVPRYGIEGKVYLGGAGALTQLAEWTFVSHEQKLVHKSGKMSIQIFDQVQVELSVDDQLNQTMRLAFRCVEPQVHASFANNPLGSIQHTSPSSKSTSKKRKVESIESKEKQTAVSKKKDSPSSADSIDIHPPPSKKRKSTS